MIFHTSTYNDIVKYYRDNIVKLGVTGDRLWQIVSINPKEVSLVDVDGFMIYLDLTEEYEVDYPLPGRVVYQHEGRACFLYRKPAKQYNRGIHQTNTGLQTLGSAKWAHLDVSIHRLQQFVDKPAYQDPDNLDTDYESWAISPQFAMNSSKLYCLNKVVGSVNLEAKAIKLTSKILLPEVKQVFPNWSIL